MLELVSQNYWWLGLSRYIAKFVTGCDACNWTKTFPMQKVGKLIPNKVPDRCWQVISVDRIRELPDSKGYNAVLVVVDCLSKRIHAIPSHLLGLHWSRLAVPGAHLASSWTSGRSNQQSQICLHIQLLLLVEFAYNNKVHTATHQTPFELDTRQHPCLGVEPMRMSTVEAVDAFAG